MKNKRRGLNSCPLTFEMPRHIAFEEAQDVVEKERQVKVECSIVDLGSLTVWLEEGRREEEVHYHVSGKGRSSSLHRADSRTLSLIVLNS